MAEEKENPLDQQIKEAELAKLKAETELVAKQAKAKWYSGKSLATIAGGVLTVVAVYSALDAIFLRPIRESTKTFDAKKEEFAIISQKLERIEIESSNNRLKATADSLQGASKQLATLNDSLRQASKDLERKAEEFQEKVNSVQKEIAALNAQEKELLATIASEKVRVIISGVFGSLDSAAYANALKQYQMIRAKNYFDMRLNPEGKGIDHQFQPQPGDSVIFDAASGLTWQQSGSRTPMRFDAAEDSIKKINAETYGGYKDWRLPTLDEAMSLMEREEKRGRYIAEQFDARLRSIWTSDKLAASYAWFVSFVDGVCSNRPFDYSYFVRAVR